MLADSSLYLMESVCHDSVSVLLYGKRLKSRLMLCSVCLPFANPVFLPYANLLLCIVGVYHTPEFCILNSEKKKTFSHKTGH